MKALAFIAGALVASAVLGLLRARHSPDVRNLARVKPGATKREVVRLVGCADVAGSHEWIYRVSPHFGFQVEFDPDERVTTVAPWAS